MASLPTHVVPLAGLQFDNDYDPASGGGDDCDTGPGVLLLVKNGDGSPHTVTLVTPGVVDGDLPVADREVVVPAGGDVAVPVTHTYRDLSTGRAQITYDSVTDVTVLVVRVSA